MDLSEQGLELLLLLLPTANTAPGTVYQPSSLSQSDFDTLIAAVYAAADALENAVVAYNTEAGGTARTLDNTAATGILPTVMPAAADVAWPQIAFPTMVTIDYSTLLHRYVGQQVVRVQ